MAEKPCGHAANALVSCCPWCSIQFAVAVRRAVQSGQKAPAPPRQTTPAAVAASGPAAAGPGTELKRALAGLGFAAFEGCSCGSLQAEMDRLGPAGCRAAVDRLAAPIAENARAAGVVPPDAAEGDLLALVRHLIEAACQAAEAKTVVVPARSSGHDAGPNPPAIPPLFTSPAIVTGGR
jgi:hypothetical protein